MREKIQIEFYETNDIEYELMVVINKGKRELQARPYVKNDDAIGEDIGERIDAILESRGHKKRNAKIIISQLNQNNQRTLSNPNIPSIVNKRLEELNYFVSIN